MKFGIMTTWTGQGENGVLIISSSFLTINKKKGWYSWGRKSYRVEKKRKNVRGDIAREIENKERWMKDDTVAR